jgi:hypothetical protein
MTKLKLVLSPQEIEAFCPGFKERWVACTLAFVETGNPFYLWETIRYCILHKQEFPEEIISYLAECASRMNSPKARKSRDFRKVLPWVFGFPSLLGPSLLNEGKRKHGRGNLLDPTAGGSPAEGFPAFPVRFATRLLLGMDEDVPTAMRNASNDVFTGKAADVDDKTLRRWLMKDFRLRAWPRSAAAWKSIVLEQHGLLLVRPDGH